MVRRGRAGTALLALVVALTMACLSVLVFAPVGRGQPSGVPDRSLLAERSTDDAWAAESTGGSQLLKKAQREGSVRVIARLRTPFIPEGRLSRPEVADQRAGIEEARAGLRAELRGTGYRTLREYDTIPYIALELSPRALQAVQRSPRVADVTEDRLEEAYQEGPASSGELDSLELMQSAPLVQAPTMWANGYTGSGQVVAVLDSGVDSAHPFLSGKVVEEACYSGNSNCPNGLTTQTGPGSGVPCTYAVTGCKHGTHVAGIAAGKGSDFSGVAKNANIMSVQVFSRDTGTACGGGEDPCALSWVSDSLAGLERVYDLRYVHNFSSVNMSLGGGQYFSNCDTDPRKAAIDNLRSVGIATVIASGNSGFTNSMSAPACISSAVSVGSTTKSDTLSSFSNSASFLSLLAPGESIYSSVPGGGFAYFSGTSMAAPHVAGAWALLKQMTPSASVASLLSSLQSTGLPVTDTRVAGGFTKPRIRIADAAGIPPQPPNDNFESAQVLSGYSASADGTNVGATLQSGDPPLVDTRSTSHTVWYSWYAGFSGPIEINTCASDYDTLLGIYAGNVLGSLTEVAANDDASECNGFGTAASKVAFKATRGTDYRILVDGYDGQRGNFTLRVIDKTPPKVKFTTPASGAMGVKRKANLTAQFSEPMDRSTLNKSTFELFKVRSDGSTTQITNVMVKAVHYGYRATLNPFGESSTLLAANTKYKAVVTTWAKDPAGNRLDQDPTLAGNQQETWTFKTGST